MGSCTGQPTTDHATQPTPPSRHTVFADAVIDARGYSTDALLAMADALTFEVADDDPDWPGEAGRHRAGERRRAIRVEIERRERLARIHAGVPSPRDERYAAWVELAQLVRERVDIIDVFNAVGYQLADVGPAEAHAPCLVCGGVDRLVIRRDPPGRCWCRRCGWSTSNVAVLTMSLRQCGFRDAVRWLAELSGLEAPSPAGHPPHSPRRLRVREV